ncbi:MAG: hypothetical protein SGJ02_09540 [bacterium]|nr:hypothetical protein [bacterium]
MKQIMILIFLGLFASLGTAYAGDGHGHNHEAAVEPAPRGGILRDSPPYKVELVLNGDKANIYVYDNDLKPIAKERLASTIKGELGFPKEKAKEVTLTLGSDSYEGILAGISAVHRFDMHVKLVIDQKEVVGDFGIDNIH